ALFSDEATARGADAPLPVTTDAARIVLRSRDADADLALLLDGRPSGTLSPKAGARSIVLNLFNDVEYVAILDHVERTPIGVAWVGSINAIEGSQVVLATSDGVLAGSIATGPKLFTVMPAGRDRYTIAQVNLASI